jgi:hypothetical protein
MDLSGAVLVVPEKFCPPSSFIIGILQAMFDSEQQAIKLPRVIGTIQTDLAPLCVPKLFPLVVEQFVAEEYLEDIFEEIVRDVRRLLRRN